MKTLLIGLTILWLSFGPAHAQQAGDSSASLNFVGAEIESVIRAIGHYTGNTFVIDPRVKGPINLVSEKPLSKSQALELLGSVLRVQGFALVKTPSYIKVVPEADAKLQAAPTQLGKLRGDQIATQIFSLNHQNATSLTNVLRPLISANNSITPDTSNNTLVITDYVDNLRRLSRIIATLDTPANATLEVVHLVHAIAMDMAATINRLLDSTTAASTDPNRVLVLADARTNTLIIRAPNAARADLARTLIAKLDQPTAQPGNVHVVYLRNAEATKLAQVLRAVVTSESGSALSPITSPVSGTGQSSIGQQSSSALASAGALQTSAPATSSTQAPLPTGGTAGFIQADPSTNTLIITANEQVYRNLRVIIDQLDARRAQVYVESLIVEVSADRAAQLGVQWAGLSGDGGAGYRVGVLTGFGSGGDNLVQQAAATLSSSGTPLVPGNGLAALMVKQNANGSVSLGMLARALETDARANILSMPNLITLDNEEARIIVGQNVPFITGQFTTAASGGSAGVNPFQTIERRDIGLSLRVRPTISQGGTVKMAIYQETSNIQQSTASGLITSKRSIDTNVLVDDGQIIVLGGLIEDTESNSMEKVPGLGNLPIVGNLFRYQSKRRSKTNLMVFLRPTVIRSNEQSISVASDRYDYIRNAQSIAQPAPGVLLPQAEPPQLPVLENGRLVGGALLNRAAPVTDFTTPKPATAPETYSIEPPQIEQR